MKTTGAKINRKRLQKRMATLAGFGMNERGGLDRILGSEAYLQSGKWLAEVGRSIGAKVYMDAVANIWMTVGEEKLPPLAVGSHHDTVPDGGQYDGALGVLLGIEVMQTLMENGISMKHPLQVVSFTAEEPNPYNLSTLGSRSITGKITRTLLEQAAHAVTGEKLSATISRLGGDLSRLTDSQLRPNAMHAFIECHIEQGSNLDDRQLSVAVVREITGIYREHIRIRGEADHAGTTPMNRRHDALLAASEMALSVEAAVNGLQRKDVAGTTGQLHVSPDAINIVPYAAELVMEIRTPDTTARSQIMDLIALKIKDIAFRRGVAFERKVLLDQPAIAMSPWVMDALYGALDAVAAERVTLNSLAGHDAVHVAGVVPTGMLFVRSIGGKSHCASEYTRMDDIETAGNILLQAIINLDQTERI